MRCYLVFYGNTNSENYIFGKFDTLCKRLDKIADIARTLEDLSDLQFMKVEGIEKTYMRYQTIVTTIKSKTYNVLDHRKLEVQYSKITSHFLFFSLLFYLTFICYL